MATFNKLDAKMLILAIADSFDAETDFDSAAQIILSSTKMANMEFLDLVAELSESDLVSLYERDGVKLFCVTEKGSAVAAGAGESLRFIDLGKILAVAKSEYERIVEGKEYTAELLPSDEDGGCVVSFTYTLHGKQRFKTSVFYDDFSRAEAALEKIRRDPAYFRAYILSYLSSNPGM